MKENLRTGDNKRFYTFLLLLLFTVNSISVAQVKFSAVCPKKQIGKNEYLQVEYVVENASNVEQISPPSFKNFSVVSGPNQQSSTSIINGAVSQSFALQFILRPNGTGTFTLPPATAKVNGKTLQSNSLSVEVTNNSSGNASGGTSFSPFSNMMRDAFPLPPVHQYDDYILHKGENISGKIKKNLFVKLDVNKSNCYVGEPIVATYKLYTRLKSESNLTKSPSFNGFSVSEMKMPDNYTTTTEKYNGREYTVYVLRKVQLYPLQPGNITLDPVEVENHITFIKADYADQKNGDIFYDMMRDFVDASTPGEGMEEQKITLQSKPLSITVKPLPDLNQPKDFKGAVGSFSIEAAAEKNNITTDEAGNLTVSVSGNGNILMVNAPAITWPEGIEVFDPKIKENIDNNSVPLKGQKIFHYPFTVSTPGQYIIPAIPFSYFDITTHGYKTLLTTPVHITVTKGTGIKAASSGQVDSSAKKGPVEGNYFKGFWLLTITGLLMAGLLIWFIKKPGTKNASLITQSPGKSLDKKIETTEKYEELIPQNPLLEAEKMLLENNINNFYYTLNNCLRKYLALKLNFPEKEFSKKKINELLDKHNVGIGTTLMLSTLLEDIELHLYAPFSSAQQLREVYENASEVIALLDRQISQFSVNL